VSAKILIADDEKRILKLVKVRIKSGGYDVITASDGKEALESVRKYLPDLVILDVGMPELNGYQVCHELRKDPKTSHIPIIILSAWVRDKVGEKSALADVYIVKPFDPKHLLAEIKFLLENKGEFKRPDVS